MIPNKRATHESASDILIHILMAVEFSDAIIQCKIIVFLWGGFGTLVQVLSR